MQAVQTDPVEEGGDALFLSPAGDDVMDLQRLATMSPADIARAKLTRAPRAVVVQSKGRRRPKGPPQLQKCRTFYALLRRRRPSHPNPTNAEPRSVSDAGSGTAGVRFVVRTPGNPLASTNHRS